MVHLAATLTTLLLLVGACAILWLTVRDSLDKIVAALIGGVETPALPARRAVRVAVKPQLRRIAPTPLRAAA